MTTSLAQRFQKFFTRTIRKGNPSPLAVLHLEDRITPAFSAVGSEFQVNTFTVGIQSLTFRNSGTSAMDADGDFVITWSNYQDGSDYVISAQRYNAAGVAQGSEFQVNSSTTDNQRFTSVAMDADGDFVISWSRSNLDGSDVDIYARRYNSAGVAQGTEFLVNSFTTNRQIYSSVAMDDAGDFVITWASNEQDGSNLGIYAQRYNSAGVAQGTEFQVNSFTIGEQTNPTVAMDADGDFVIAWKSFAQDSVDDDIYAQRYNAAGVAQGAEFHVNSYTDSTQASPSVAMDTDGDFVIAWSSFGQDGSSDSIYAKRYNAAGVAQGTEFQVNSFTTNEQVNPSVALDADGDFVISWSSFGQDGSNYGIYAQRYNAAGVAQDTEFRVNSFTSNVQIFSSVAMNNDGDLVISWSSFGQDGSDYGIYAQRYLNNSPPLLADPGNPTINELVPFSIVLNGTDGENDPLTYTIASGLQPGMSLNPTTGAFNWTPTELQDGVYPVTFEVSDGVVTTTRSITITVDEVNVAPSLNQPGNQATTEGQLLRFTLTGSDPDVIAGVPQTLVYSIANGGINGMGIDGISGVFTWTPTSTQSGTYPVTVRITDFAGASQDQTFTITVADGTPITPPVTPPVTPPITPPRRVDQTRISTIVTTNGSTLSVFDGAGNLVRTVDSPLGAGVRIVAAAADVNGDGTPDFIVVGGPGSAAVGVVFNGIDGTELFRFETFESSFLGGAFVSAGDFNQDGFADIVITPDVGGSSRTRVISGRDRSIMADFFSIEDPAFRGGARAGVADFNGDGIADLLVGAGQGGGPRVALFDGVSIAQNRPTKLINDLFVFEPALSNGAYVTGGDINGDGRAELIAGGGPGGGPRVLALDGRDLLAGRSTSIVNFFAGDVASRDGVRVVGKDVNGDANADIVVGSDGEGLIFSGADFAAGIESPVGDALAGTFLGGVFVG